MVYPLIFFYEYSSEQRRIASENSTALLEQFLDAEDEARSEVFKQIEKTFPKSSSHILALMIEAGSLFEAGQNDEARNLLEKALSLSPNVLLADLIELGLPEPFAISMTGRPLWLFEICKGRRLQIFGVGTYRRYLFSEKKIPEAFEAYDRALESLREGERRPLLELKRNSLSPLDGSFAEVEDTLSDAVRKAEELTQSPESSDE